MQFIQTSIPDIWIIQPKVLGDSRGYFFESWREDEFKAHIGAVHFVQENESKSFKGVLRGLHYQRGEHAQAKLVRVVKGTVVDVAVDCRRSSSTFGEYVAVELSGENHRQLFIPRGFAHGFIALSEEVIFTYKVDNYYNAASEETILWNDSQLNIEWPSVDVPLVQARRDLEGRPFAEAACFD